MSFFGRFEARSASSKPFSECCSDMQHAVSHGATRLLRVEENGVFYMAVGMAVGVAETPDGLGWFDQAILFCPFCGVQREDLDQTAASIREAILAGPAPL
jgi:hypothetical protein